MKTATSLVAAALAATLIASCGSKSTAPATVTVTQPGSNSAPGAPSSSAAAPAAQITIPDGLVGENAEIAQSKLEGLGLTKVELSSSNPKYSLVLRASNWTVTSIDPPPGTQVNANDPVIVKVTKP
jgi:PASTA domain